MDHLRAIILTLALCLSCAAQPFTEGELGWNIREGFASGGMQFYVIPENFQLTNQLIGIGSGPLKFAITQSPANGTISGLDPVTGTNVYTPNNNFVGNDAFAYSVTLSRKAKVLTPGAVFITVITNLDTNACNVWTYTNHFFSVNGQPAPVCMPPGFNSGAQSFDWSWFLNWLAYNHSSFDTNVDWTMSVNDTYNIWIPTNWYYTAGDNPTNWTPALSTVYKDPDMLFVDPMAGANPGGYNCASPYGDVVTWKLCPAAPPVASCENPTNEPWSYALNGGSYTFTTNQNYFIANGFNTGGPVCTIPAVTTAGFTICNNESTNRNMVVFGQWATPNTQASPYSFSFGLNGTALSLYTWSPFASYTFGNPYDCPNEAEWFGSQLVTISNLVVIGAGQTTNLTYQFRLYHDGTGGTLSTAVAITNFWQQ